MTLTETYKIRRAIKLLMGEECLMLEAVAILAPMCGLKYPAAENPQPLGRVRSRRKADKA